MYEALGNVHMLEQMLMHEVVIALGMGRWKTDVFVQIEGRDLREIKPLLPVHPDELAVHEQGRTPRRQAQNA